MDSTADWHSSSDMPDVAVAEEAESVCRATFWRSRRMGKWPGTRRLAETEAARAAMMSWEYMFGFGDVVKVLKVENVTSGVLRKDVELGG